MFLDLGLEAYMRQLCERIVHIDIGFEAYIRQGAILISNLVLSYGWEEIAACKEEWDGLVIPLSKDLHQDNARKVRSVLDRIKQALGEVNDQFTVAL